MIRIDPDVFTYQDDLGHSIETFVVLRPHDAQTVGEALRKAGRRFMLVDETGVEHPDQESADDALHADRYTPNYVSLPVLTETGVAMYVDCKGAMDDPMAEKLRDILREELEAIGYEGRVSTTVWR